MFWVAPSLEHTTTFFTQLSIIVEDEEVTRYEIYGSIIKMCNELEFTHKLNSTRVVKITRLNIKACETYHNLHGSVQNLSLRRRSFSAHKITLKYHWCALCSKGEVSRRQRYSLNPQLDSPLFRFSLSAIHRKFIKIK